MFSIRAALVLCASAVVHQFAVADTVYSWNFDSAWTGSQVTDSSGYGVFLGARSQTDGTGATVRNSTSLNYWTAADYSGSGGVAILTNGGQVPGLFSGINFKPTGVDPASFSQLVDRSSNPFVQVDIWNENNPKLNQQLYTNSVGTDQTDTYRFIAANGSNVLTSSGWHTSGWNTFRIELHPDGVAHGYVNGYEVGTASGIQKLTDINNGSLGMMFTSREVVIDNFKFGAVSPVPEPESYAMMLVGLTLIGAIANRRKSRTSDNWIQMRCLECRHVY
jgi:hypothetical protein